MNTTNTTDVKELNIVEKEHLQHIVKVMNHFYSNVTKNPIPYIRKVFTSVDPADFHAVLTKKSDSIYKVSIVCMGKQEEWEHEDQLYNEKQSLLHIPEHPIHQMVSMTDIFNGME